MISAAFHVIESALLFLLQKDGIDYQLRSRWAVLSRGNVECNRLRVQRVPLWSSRLDWQPKGVRVRPHAHHSSTSAFVPCIQAVARKKSNPCLCIKDHWALSRHSKPKETLAVDLIDASHETLLPVLVLGVTLKLRVGEACPLQPTAGRALLMGLAPRSPALDFIG